MINIILIPISFFVDVSRGEQALMIAVCLLAVIVELFNSAIEAVVDRVSLEKHTLSKNAKDMGSAAQFIALSIIAITWVIILFSLMVIDKADSNQPVQQYKTSLKVGIVILLLSFCISLNTPS